MPSTTKSWEYSFDDWIDPDAAAKEAAKAAGGTDVTYTVNPLTQEGSGAYGAVPGAIGIPANLYKGVQSIYPNLGATTTATSDLIASQLAGEFTPETEAALWDTANRYGVASGMPGAGLWSNKFMGNVAGAKEALQQQGLTNYNTTTANLSRMVDQPELSAEIAARNAQMAASPNPTEAAEQLKADTSAGLISGYRWGTSPAAGTRATTGSNVGSQLTSPTTVDKSYLNRLGSYNDYWANQPAAQTGTPGATATTSSQTVYPYDPMTDEGLWAELFGGTSSYDAGNPAAGTASSPTDDWWNYGFEDWAWGY